MFFFHAQRSVQSSQLFALSSSPSVAKLDQDIRGAGILNLKAKATIGGVLWCMAGLDGTTRFDRRGIAPSNALQTKALPKTIIEADRTGLRAFGPCSSHPVRSNKNRQGMSTLMIALEQLTCLVWPFPLLRSSAMPVTSFSSTLNPNGVQCTCRSEDRPVHPPGPRPSVNLGTSTSNLTGNTWKHPQLRSRHLYATAYPNPEATTQMQRDWAFVTVLSAFLVAVVMPLWLRKTRSGPDWIRRTLGLWHLGARLPSLWGHGEFTGRSSETSAPIDHIEVHPGQHDKTWNRHGIDMEWMLKSTK